MATAVRWLPPAVLYLLACIVGLVAVGLVSFPVSEVSAYVAGVAANLVNGRGLVSDAAWSFASGPPVMPRPAFDLWQPLPGFQAALGMVVLGPTYGAAQVANVLVAAALAPLAWLVGRDAARRNGLGQERVAAVGVGAGLVTAVFGPFLVAIVAPDSSAPFAVLAVAACLVMPRAATGARGAGLLLGTLLGLAYLTRQEAIWLGLAYLWLTLSGVGMSDRPRVAWRVSRWVLVSGAAVTVGWLVRNAIIFEGGAFRQALENVWITNNEQIFAYLERPSLDGWLAGAPAALIGRIAAGFAHDAVNVLLISLVPIGIIGVIAAIVLRKTPALQGVSTLRALVVAGIATFVATGLLFPVATRWGTYQHSSEPTAVALIVLTLLGLDALVAAIGRRRGWHRSNAWLAPLAVLAIVVPLAVLSLQTLQDQAIREAARQSAVSAAFASLPGDGAVVTDHPMWVAASTGRPALALPDESTPSVLQLAAIAQADWLLVLDERGRYPALLLREPSPCLVPRAIAVPNAELWQIQRGCR